MFHPPDAYKAALSTDNKNVSLRFKLNSESELSPEAIANEIKKLENIHNPTIESMTIGIMKKGAISAECCQAIAEALYNLSVAKSSLKITLFVYTMYGLWTDEEISNLTTKLSYSKQGNISIRFDKANPSKVLDSLRESVKKLNIQFIVYKEQVTYQIPPALPIPPALRVTSQTVLTKPPAPEPFISPFIALGEKIEQYNNSTNDMQKRLKKLESEVEVLRNTELKDLRESVNVLRDEVKSSFAELYKVIGLLNKKLESDESPHKKQRLDVPVVGQETQNPQLKL